MIRQVGEALVYAAVIAAGGAVTGWLAYGDPTRIPVAYVFTVVALERGRVLRYMEAVREASAEIRHVLMSRGH